MLGRTLGHFRVVEKIGEGGMGVVYRADDLRLQRQVALKVLPPELLGDAQRRRRLLREARAAAAVTHPNIAAVYDVDEAEGVVFIAMELVQGKTLREVIGGRPLPLLEALRLATEIAEGLEMAHRSHVIHRDLKPDNVMIGPGRHAKILDFGLAKLIEEHGGAVRMGISRAPTLSAGRTVEGAVLGTPAYMSPEQARGEPADRRSDLFSFGIVLYETVTGTAPFRGRTTTDILTAILRDAPVPAARINPEVTPELEGVIVKCLEKDPEDRYHHADELLTDLRRLKRALESGLHPAPAPRRRWPLVLGAGLATVVALALTVSRLGWPGRVPREAARGDIESLAVLPLQNQSGDPAQEYLTDGITEELIAGLTRIGTLRVISRSSTMRYKNTQKPLAKIAQELGVDVLMEGSVWQSGGRVRVTAQLVHAATDRNLWAATFERDVKDVLALQGELAMAIAREVRAELTPEERSRLARTDPVNAEAHDAYLRGRYQLNKFTVEGSTKGMEYFKQALEIDSNFALAWVGLADSYFLLSDMYLAPREAIPRAKAAAMKALEIDDSLGEAYASLGYALSRYEWDWEGAEKAYRKAIELNPGYAAAHWLYGTHLVAMGRFEEAARELDRAHALEPLSQVIAVNAVWPLYFGRQYDSAIDRLEKIVQAEPDSGPAYGLLGWAYEQKGDFPQAISALEKCRSLYPEVLDSLAYLGHAYAASGQRSKALEALRVLEVAARTRHVPAFDIAMIHVALGNKNEAFEWLEKAYQGRGEWLMWIKVDPKVDGLRSDPRYHDLVRRVGLPPG